MNAADATNEVGFNQYSLMLNDVEVYRGKQAQFTLSNVSLAVFPAMNAISASYFLRVAPVAYGSIQDYGPIAMISPSNGSVYQFPAFSN